MKLCMGCDSKMITVYKIVNSIVYHIEHTVLTIPPSPMPTRKLLSGQYKVIDYLNLIKWANQK